MRYPRTMARHVRVQREHLRRLATDVAAGTQLRLHLPRHAPDDLPRPLLAHDVVEQGRLRHRSAAFRVAIEITFARSPDPRWMVLCRP